MNSQQLEQLRREVKAEMPAGLTHDPVVQDFIYKLSLQNKILINDVNILKALVNTLTDWTHGEKKNRRKGPDNKTKYWEQFMKCSKNEVEIIKLM